MPRLAVAEGDLCILVSSRRTEKKHKGEENGKRIEGEAMLAAFTRFFFKESLTPKTLHMELTFFYSQGEGGWFRELKHLLSQVSSEKLKSSLYIIHINQGHTF